MRTLTLIFLVLLVPACTMFKGKTPAQRYYAFKSDYERALITAIAYKRSCETKPRTDTCHTHVSKLEEINHRIASAFETADTLGLQTTSKERDAALIAAGSAIQELLIYLLQLEVK